MTCADCKHPNAPERNYCGSCGTVLARYCAGCGFRNGSTDRYCGGCGGGLEAGLANSPRPAVSPPLAPTTPMASGAAVDPLTAELLAVAAEALLRPAGEADPRVTQDDIDTLFGD